MGHHSCGITVHRDAMVTACETKIFPSHMDIPTWSLDRMCQTSGCSKTDFDKFLSDDFEKILVSSDSLKSSRNSLDLSLQWCLRVDVHRRADVGVT